MVVTFLLGALFLQAVIQRTDSVNRWKSIMFVDYNFCVSKYFELFVSVIALSTEIRKNFLFKNKQKEKTLT